MKGHRSFKRVIGTLYKLADYLVRHGRGMEKRIFRSWKVYYIKRSILRLGNIKGWRGRTEERGWDWGLKRVNTWWCSLGIVGRMELKAWIWEAISRKENRYFLFWDSREQKQDHCIEEMLKWILKCWECWRQMVFGSLSEVKLTEAGYRRQAFNHNFRRSCDKLPSLHLQYWHHYTL